MEGEPLVEVEAVLGARNLKTCGGEAETSAARSSREGDACGHPKTQYL